MKPAAIEFFVSGDPKAQPRPRAFARGGHVRMYDPGTAEGWKGLIAAAAKPHRPPAPLTGPVDLTIRYFLRRPKNHYRTGRYADELKPGAPSFHYSHRFDVDNLAKAVMDCLTQLGFWEDDGQVALLSVGKRFIRPGAVPGAFISLVALPEGAKEGRP